MYDEFFTKAQALMAQGVPFATATVVRAEKPSSGKPGDKAIITSEGVMFGWIGGSCAQPTVVREALRALAADECRLIRLSTTPESQTPRDGLIDLPMTCYSGGTLEIYIEPQRPRPRLMIVGTLPVAQALAHLGKAMNYHVIAADPAGHGEGMPHADEVLHSLEEAAAQIRPFTYVVIATHGDYDELALERILPSAPTYVGLVASPRRADTVRQYLVDQGISQTELLPLKAPAGLDIQARRGDEIALSIMAEIVQKRCNAELLDLALLRERQAPVLPEVAVSGTNVTFGATFVEPAMAIDPICHMAVNTATAAHVSEFQGIQYYFCCSGCKRKFEAEPGAYIGEAAVRTDHH